MGTLTVFSRPRVGRVRIKDKKLTASGICVGDVAIIDLDSPPKDGEWCVAFTARGELVVRKYRLLAGGYVSLWTSDLSPPELYAPAAVVIYGRVSRLERVETRQTA